MENLAQYLSGEKLYGDDLTFDEITKWYQDEQEGYAELGAKNKSSYTYVYHALNALHGFKHLPQVTFKHALGFGSAYGDEFLPVIKQIERITILEPSDVFTNDEIDGVPCAYQKPSLDGYLPFRDGVFDFITCLGVLHHIPNLTTVMKELYRCSSHNAYILVREPIRSMGDWSRPRPGLTKRERGIPLPLFLDMITGIGFHVSHQAPCIFPPIPKVFNRFGGAAYNSAVATRIDAICCKLLGWNGRYHPTTLIQKLGPASVYFVLRR